MAGYGPAAPSAATGAPRSELIGAQALAAACEAGRPGVSGRKPVWGSWMQFSGPGLAKIVASFGYQWILLDAEHGAIGDTEMHNMIPAIAGTGVAPIVRVPAPELAFFKRALDAGAFGVMVPMVETKEQAEAVVRMCKFPPQGMRGCGSPFAPAHFGQSMPEYLATANKTTMVIVQIETPLGLKNVNEIAAVPGIDMLFIGPNDLACSTGNGAKNHMDCADVQDAIEVIRVAAEKAGKFSGIFCVSAEQAAARFAQGFQFINIGGDIVAILSWMGSTLQQANALASA